MATAAAAIGNLGLSARDRAMRRTGVGASEVAKVIGLVPGAIDVWAEKEGIAPKDFIPNSSLQEFGHRIEDVIADAWLARHPGVRIYTPGTLRHPKHPWALATPDRVVARPGQGRPARPDWLQLLEAKSVFHDQPGDYGEEGTDEVPERHLVQAQWQLGVTGMEHNTIAALVHGEYREYPIDRDDELIQNLFERVGAWWERHVVARVPPPVDGSEAYRDFLRRRYPSDLLPPLEPTPELELAVDALRVAREREKAAAADELLAANALRALIGQAGGVLGLCTYKQNKHSEQLDLNHAVEGLIIRLCENPLSGGYSLPRAKVEALWEEVKRDFTVSKPGARQLRLTKKGA